MITVCLSGSCFAATHYVVPVNPSAVDPYTNWADAATNIQWAVNAATAGDTVLVSNGTYYLTNQVTIDKAITVQSVNGRDVTIVDGNNYAGKPVTNRCFYLTNSATLDGFTISNGFYNCGGWGDRFGGAGVKAQGGALVKNCAIVNNVASNNMSVVDTLVLGGGASIDDSIMSNCVINGNRAYAYYARGGGVFGDNSSTISDCVIESNQCFGVGYAYSAGCDMVRGVLLENSLVRYNIGDNAITVVSGTIIRNCLVCHNVRGGIFCWGWGSAVWATFQNCTIVSNTGTTFGGLSLYVSNLKTTRVENVVIYGNVGTYSNFYNKSGGTGFLYIVNSCIAPTNSFPTAEGRNGVYYTNNIEVNPQFVDKDAGNWRLTASSPCVNTGTNDDWMTGAVDLDTHSRIDRFSRKVDMGCYENIFRRALCFPCRSFVLR